MDWFKTFFKGFIAFAISLGVLVLTSVAQGLENYIPTSGAGAVIWPAISAFVIGAVHSLINFLKNKEKLNTVVDSK